MINNFSGKPPHTIHLRIQNPEEIKKMTHQLIMIDHFIQDNECPPAQLNHSPHIVISDSIPENCFNKILNAFSGKSFNGSFMSEKIQLYRRPSVEMNFQLVTSLSLAK